VDGGYSKSSKMLNFDEILPFLAKIIALGILSTSVLYYFTKRIFYSAVISIVKYGICFIYFVIWSNYSPIVLLDDQTYYEQSILIFEKAHGSFTFLFDVENIAYIFNMAGGMHIGYFIYNFISFLLFGQNYYSPVILNIFFSVIAGIVFYKTLLLARFDKKFCLFFLIFFLLHWDLIAWSSFINLKDILVLLLTICSLNCMLRLNYGKKRIVPILTLSLIGVALLFIRFYLAYFLVVTGVVYFVIVQMYRVKSRWTSPLMKLAVLLILPASFYFVFIRVYAASLSQIGGATNVILGFVRFILTPFPLTIEENYSFLLVSSVLHWIMLPFMFYGCYLFIRRHFVTLMPFIILAMLLCVFYGSFAELQGPRHRVLLLYFISLTQALSIYEFLKMLTKPKQELCAESLEQQ